jgi:hypothetical protein
MIKILKINLKLFVAILTSLFLILFFTNSEFTKTEGFQHSLRLKLYVPVYFEKEHARLVRVSVYKYLRDKETSKKYGEYTSKVRFKGDKFLYNGKDPNVAEKAKKFANEYLDLYDKKIAFLENNINKNINSDKIQLKLDIKDLLNYSISNNLNIKFKSYIHSEKFNEVKVDYASVIIKSFIISFIFSLLFLLVKETFFRNKKLVNFD